MLVYEIRTSNDHDFWDLWLTNNSENDEDRIEVIIATIYEKSHVPIISKAFKLYHDKMESVVNEVD